jgi:hypothetical protein
MSRALLNQAHNAMQEIYFHILSSNNNLPYKKLQESIEAITAALAQPEPVDVRAAFEIHFGAIPRGCVWNGRGFSLTAFNAWEATNYANLFKGFAAAWGVAPPAPDTDRLDAQRYRWLKMKPSPGVQYSIMTTPWGKWDAVIDAAIVTGGQL